MLYGILQTFYTTYNASFRRHSIRQKDGNRVIPAAVEVSGRAKISGGIFGWLKSFPTFVGRNPTKGIVQELNYQPFTDNQ